MQIILMHPRWLHGKRLKLTIGHLVVGLATILTLIVAAAYSLTLLLLRFGGEIRLPFLQQAVASVKQESSAPRSQPGRDDTTLIMLKLGEMQARMMRLDSLGQRVQHLAGVSPEAFNFDEIPGRGGYEHVSANRLAVREAGMSELMQTMDALAAGMEQRADYLSAVEAALMDLREEGGKLAITHPISGAIHSSPFGLRADPFTGKAAFHEGQDFAAPQGTPIVAAAGGVVIAAGAHEQYGNMVDISHGNDIVTRYAHASRLRVRQGDIVRRGQHIADVGSTGRSTGTHLHFEVQVGSLAQNPQVFLARAAEPVQLAEANRD